MSYFIRIFCQSTQKVTRHEIQEFILGGIHFDKHPVFIPAFLDPDSMVEDWGQLDITYEPDKQPVQVYRNVGDSLLETEIRELNDLISAAVAPDSQQSLRDVINDARQVFAIEINRESLSEDAWAMLDSLEAYLAGNLMGLVYAPEDGFYGSGLELLYKVG
jgi:hypothetical protein